VAEDSPVNLVLIQAYLKGPSFDVHTAPNGAIAVEKFQSSAYDVVLMDIQMPVMDGYTATRLIREWEAEHQKRPTPVLALTAKAFKEEEQESLAAGCDAHLIKPIRKAELLEALRKFTQESDGAPSINPAPVERIQVKPPDGIEEAIPLFLESTREDLEALSDALRADDYARVRFIGHDLKGTGGGYGFDEISVIGKCIEEAALRSDRREIAKQIAALADYLSRVDVVYN
jgi:CheY-like chemotaxis protein/HPt (histidine-containing phosphotransfer) domain-containing protein